MRRALTVQALAREADLGLDEVIVTLWDMGLDQIEKPSDMIPARHVN